MAKREPHVAILVDYLSYFGRCVVRGLGNYLCAHGHWTIYGEPKRLALPLPNLRTWKGDGIIAQIAERRTAKALLGVARRGIPVVDIAGSIPGLSLPRVTVDSVAIGKLAAEHFLSNGFRNLAFCGTAGILHSDLRLQGFRGVGEAAGARVDVYEASHMHRILGTPEADMDELARWITSLPKPCGAFAINDGRARQIADACHRLAVRVPDDVAIVGVDNDDVICELASPVLSSVAVPIEQIGCEAAALLDQLMAGKRPPRREILIPPIRVVTRYSSDALAVGDADIAKALRLIREHAKTPFNVDQLVRELLVSRRSLEKRFRKLVGRTPHQEIEHVHLAHARRLLVETEWPIPRIAEHSGYSGLEHFSHAFRKKVGIAPVAYRRTYRADRGGNALPASHH